MSSSEPNLRILSLGAGVQSTTLLLMAVEGALPKLDYAIFADTGWEPRAVYDHLDKVTVVAEQAELPILRVSKGNLRADMLASGKKFASIPYFIRSSDNTKGIGRRQCTSEYKLVPIQRKVRELLGATPPDFRRVPRGRFAEQWIGFSVDEIERVSDHRPVSYIVKRYPLIELGMNRQDCMRWLKSRGWTSVEKSACIGCPYHGNRMWRNLRDNQPEEWRDAIEFDAALRRPGAQNGQLRGEAFLHRSLLPLSVAPIDRVTSAEWKTRQGNILDAIADAELEERLKEEGDPDGCSPYGCRSGMPV